MKGRKLQNHSILFCATIIHFQNTVLFPIYSHFGSQSVNVHIFWHVTLANYISSLRIVNDSFVVAALSYRDILNDELERKMNLVLFNNFKLNKQ